MQIEPPSSSPRRLRSVSLSSDLVVVGGGMAGLCCAITAARAGIQVILVQDRPVLGGNASSEVRLWILGATSHLGNNNRWSREGGVIDEILIENTFRNPEGNPSIFDALLLEKVTTEPNLTLLLNTAVFEVIKLDADTIAGARAFCSQNSTLYELRAPLFCDASGDGILGFLSGAAFRMGAESSNEFGEKFAPSADYGELLGHSIYFYSKETGRPVSFTAPSFALKDISRIPRYRNFNSGEFGCRLWWIEYGGRLDTVHATEEIKWELWRIVYGVWDHIKNSGKFPEAETLTLEWVGAIPGKRESRRFEGEHILIQQDIIEQRQHHDAVAYGGWSIDLHPSDGIFSEKPGCNQWHSKGIYQIPYRCLYSRNIHNLFLAGRIISTSHVAFGSSRVMATCAHAAQAVGQAAAQCIAQGARPRELSRPENIKKLQLALRRSGQFIPGLRLDDPDDLIVSAKISASSEYILDELPPDGPTLSLENPWAMLLPVKTGEPLHFSVWAESAEDASLRAELRVSEDPENFTPEITLDSYSVTIEKGPLREIAIRFEQTLPDPRYVFICFYGSAHIRLRCSRQRVTGVLSLCHRVHRSVANSAVQSAPLDIGVDNFEFWLPPRRPGGHNLAMRFHAPLHLSQAAHVSNGTDRPRQKTNAWIARMNDPRPTLTAVWAKPVRIARLELTFDTDFDHPMESVLMEHPEPRMPFCIRSYRIRTSGNSIVAEEFDNHQSRRVHHFNPPLSTSRIAVEVDAPHACIPAALFSLRAYSE